MRGCGTLLDANVVKIASTARAGSTVTLTMQTYYGHTYTLQTTDSLSGAWTNLTAGFSIQTDPNGIRTWTIANQSAVQRFYRITVGP